jgi:N-acetylneuraminic acid mutarotase
MKKIVQQWPVLIVLFMLFSSPSTSQQMPEYKEFSPLPNTEGMAGMFAGQSNGQLFCMGGANFPEKKPWEGGKKKWHDDIYWFFEDREWVKLDVKMPNPLAYGVSIEYKNEIILVGGNDEKDFHAAVTGMKWNGKDFTYKSYPALPVPLANMAGALLDHMIIVAGGTSAFTGTPLNGIYLLDLENISAGWVALPSWPGAGRTQPVAGSFGGSFYLFSGEMAGVDHLGKPERKMLQDAFRYTPAKKNGHWLGTWEVLPMMPRAATASANPVPVLADGSFVFWGGVDAEKALHKDPTTHPGIDRKIFTYSIHTKTWSFLGNEMQFEARVTLPAVRRKDHWLYISGEIKPGIRTNKIVGIKNNDTHDK